MYLDFLMFFEELLIFCISLTDFSKARVEQSLTQSDFLVIMYLAAEFEMGKTEILIFEVQTHASPPCLGV